MTDIIKNPGWWKRRTNLERHAISLAVVLLFAIIILFIALIAVITTHHKNNETESKSLCENSECIAIAATILTNMDRSVNPCDDFYRFACGNYIKYTNIPDDQSTTNYFSVINEQLKQQLKRALEQPIKTAEIKPFRLAKKFYNSCMNKTMIELRDLKPMNEILKKIGGWPVLDGDNLNENNFNWRHIEYVLGEFGYPVWYLLKIVVGFNAKNSTLRMITLDEPSLSLDREFLVKDPKDEIIQAYHEYMVDVAVIFGANKEIAKRDMTKVLELEMKLANLTLPSDERRNISELFHPLSIEELQIQYPSIPWLEHINSVLNPPHKIKKNDIIDLSVPKFLKQLESLLSDTPNRTLANYLSWRTIQDSIDYLPNKLRDRKLQFNNLLTGKTEMELRWKECITEVSTLLAQSVSALYVRNYFNDEAKETATVMVRYLRDEFKEVLKEVEWMDATTRNLALQKADSIATHIGFPNELLDDNVLVRFYQMLELNQDLYLESALNASLFMKRILINQLDEPSNKTSWIQHSTSTVINAYYNAAENSIFLPAGILQGIFFSSKRPKYMNFGGIGFVIGHEITHGFDDQGRQFDRDGNVVDWWNPLTEQAFLNQTQCIIDQYSNYTSHQAKMNLNGVNTQSENIADNGGVKEAYRAYRKWAKEQNGPEPQLPGLPYTPEQMFWISTANVWCAKYRTEYLRNIIITNEHSPNSFRVVGSLANSEEFAKDFQCALGSKMNPKHKCHVW